MGKRPEIFAVDRVAHEANAGVIHPKLDLVVLNSLHTVGNMGAII